MVGLPPPENPAYPSDFSLSISAGSRPVFSASSWPALYCRISVGQTGPHLFAYRFFFRIQILSFARIFGQVVELGFGRIDEVVIFRLNAAQFAPVEVQAGQKSLRIQAAGFFCLSSTS